MIRILSFLIVLMPGLVWLEKVHAEEKFAPPEVSLQQLDNGLKIAVIPDHRAPVVTHMIWYKAGSADEPIGKSGIAHFLEHLMFKGTSNKPAGEFSRKVAEIGGQENAFTTVDFTAYYQKVSPQALLMVMEYEADRMENLILSDAVVEPEKKVILEERRSRIGSSPSALLNETVEATLFKHHPYGTPIIGWENEMLKLTKEDAIAFYNKYYSPNNAVLVVAGDVDQKTVMDLAKKTYGNVKPRVKEVVRNRVIEPEPIAAITVEYHDERVQIPSFSRVYTAPSYNQGPDGEAEALDLLADILGGSSTSRIYKNIVLGKEIATSAGAWFQGAALNLAKFGFYGRPRGTHSVEEIESAIDEEIENLLTNGITQKELDRSRNNLLKTVLFERDSQTTMARLYGTVLSLEGSLDDIHLWPQALKKITVADVNKVARKVLKKHRSVTAYLKPKS